MDDELIQRRKEDLAELNEDMLFADGLEPALIGAVRIFSKTVALYDYEKCIEHLMHDGVTYEEVVEHLEFNTLGAYVGENTPGFFVKTESFEPQRSEDDLVYLQGQDLLDALTEARQKGDFKGWSFSEISVGGSVLPMTVYDHKSEGHPITRHQAVVSTGNDGGKIASITVATTTKDGTEHEDFVPASLLRSLQKIVERLGETEIDSSQNPKDPTARILELAGQLTDQKREEMFRELRSEFCYGCGMRQPKGRLCQCQNDE